MGFQELNIVDIVKPITKYAATIMDPASIRYHMEKALYLAKNGRSGPVWIDIPLDVQASEIEEAALREFDPHEIPNSFNPERLQRQVSGLIDLFNRAERPVLLVGNGVRLAKAMDEFLDLIEILQLPVLTSWKAIDFLPEDHPLFVGRPGLVGQRGANFAQQNSDWILIIGARLDLGQTAYNHSSFARAAKKIMVDVDSAEIRKMSMPIDIALCADAKDFIRTLIQQSGKVVRKDRSRWLARCKEWQSRYPVVLPEYWDDRERVNDYVLIEVLSDAMRSEDLLIPGSSGACSERTMQAFKVKEGIRIFNSQGLGPMGFGIPASIGGCLASGKRRTICIDGDGGFQLNIQELETVRRLDLPIKFFVLNNQGYASIRATQRSHFGGHFVASTCSSGLTLPDVGEVARAYGIPALRIKDNTKVRSMVRKVLETDGPVVCEVMSSPDQPTAPRVTSRQLPDGSMVSAPLEDLWPFLDREEFKDNMVIS
jgi:acetolactate synthase-1/2/3 large subunit